MITNEWVHEFETFWEDNKNDLFAARDLIIASISPQVSLIMIIIVLCSCLI
jgi:hypothetical protein